MIWLWKPFAELNNIEVYEILRLRQEVFIKEQNCIYVDADGLDLQGHHLLGWLDDKVVAYLRVLPTGTRFSELSFGRVVTSQSVRGQGFGQELIRLGLEKIQESFGRCPIRISAQSHLQQFYGKFGFRVDGSEYLEDRIPHVQMIRL